MQKTLVSTKNKTRSKRRPTTSHRRQSQPPLTGDYPYVMEGDEATHVLVPIDEYDRLLATEMARDAVKKLQDKSVKWIDARDFALQLAGERIAKARKAAGLTQKQLAARLKVPQSQISRIERNPDRTTVRTLKRIAKALGVDVRALL